MRYTIFDMPILNSLLRWFSLGALKASGWRKEGRVPNINKYVVIAAPHTSNWDLPIGLMLAFAFRVKVCWMGKDSLFRGPFCTIFKWLGGLPVDRRKSTGTVARSVETFEKEDKKAMIIAPEGTRRSGGHWKSGFYQIARGANVPIVLGFLDYKRKVGGIGPVITPSGDLDEDMWKIRQFYSGVTPKRPERAKPAAVAAGI